MDWGNGQSMNINMSQGQRCVHETVSTGGCAHEGAVAHGFDLVADLRMTRFGAHKALALRDAFLRG